LALATFGLAGCKDCAGCAVEGAGLDGSAGSGGGGTGGAGGSLVLGEAKPLHPRLKLRKDQQVLFVGGFMSELYDELSLNLENEINDALHDAARSLNVHIDLPGDKSLDIAIGDAIAKALPRIRLPIEPGRFISFYTQMRQLEAEGIAYQNISMASASFDTSQSVEHNAAAILELLRSTDKRVVIVSHSKGGLDTLEALLEAPELWGDKVIGWIALQAPFFGSPVADPAPSVINDALLGAVGGHGQSLDDLKTVTRALYMEANQEGIAKLTASIPVISAYTTYEAKGTVTEFAREFARGIFGPGLLSEITDLVVESYKATPRNLPRVIAASSTAAIKLVRQRVEGALSEAIGTLGLLTLTNVYLNDVLRIPNDGLVPRDSTVLPGAIHRELPIGDHASPVMDVDPFKNFWTAEDRNRVTLDLIAEVQRLAADD
jgi:pimeloyl-ACP methyl ester carboxylesterase